jgi:hypothetical protein
MATITGNTDTGGAVYNWNIQQGRTTKAKNFTVTIGESPATITKVEMALRRFGAIVKLYSSDTGDFTIGSGSFVWNEHQLDIARGEYQYDLKVTHSGGILENFMKGVVIVSEEITP